MRLLRCLCAFLCTFFLFIHPVQADVQLSAQSAVLIDQQTGDIIVNLQAHEKQSIASITKVMTAIIAVESGRMNDMVNASRHAIHTEGSSIYLEEGEKMRMNDLVYGLMLRSGNDASIAIAEHIGGSEAGFVYMMNEKARWIGMTNTHFANPHGLDDDMHYSTAYDMALLMQYAMKNKQFATISEATSFRADNRSYGWINKNKLLTHLYEHSTGGKTGYTGKAGRTLISTAKKGRKELIAVTLNAPDDWNDHIRLFTHGFNQEQASAQHNQQIKRSEEHHVSNQSIRTTFSTIVKHVLRLDHDG